MKYEKTIAKMTKIKVWPNVDPQRVCILIDRNQFKSNLNMIKNKSVELYLTSKNQQSFSLLIYYIYSQLVLFISLIDPVNI
jgi:hypothetical protein